MIESIKHPTSSHGICPSDLFLTESNKYNNQAKPLTALEYYDWFLLCCKLNGTVFSCKHPFLVLGKEFLRLALRQPTGQIRFNSTQCADVCGLETCPIGKISLHYYNIKISISCGNSPRKQVTKLSVYSQVKSPSSLR